jgi:hypothetical protein
MLSILQKITGLCKFRMLPATTAGFTPQCFYRWDELAATFWHALG